MSEDRNTRVLFEDSPPTDYSVTAPEIDIRISVIQRAFAETKESYAALQKDAANEGKRLVARQCIVRLEDLVDSALSYSENGVIADLEAENAVDRLVATSQVVSAQLRTTFKLLRAARPSDGNPAGESQPRQNPQDQPSASSEARRDLSGVIDGITPFASPRNTDELSIHLDSTEPVGSRTRSKEIRNASSTPAPHVSFADRAKQATSAATSAVALRAAAVLRTVGARTTSAERGVPNPHNPSPLSPAGPSDGAAAPAPTPPPRRVRGSKSSKASSVTSKAAQAKASQTDGLIRDNQKKFEEQKAIDELEEEELQRKLADVRHKMALDAELHKSDVSTFQTLQTNGQKVIEAFENSTNFQPPGEGLEYTTGNIGLGGEPCGERTQNWVNGCTDQTLIDPPVTPTRLGVLPDAGANPPGSPVSQVSGLQLAIDRVIQKRRLTPLKTLPPSLTGTSAPGPIPAVIPAVIPATIPAAIPATFATNTTFIKPADPLKGLLPSPNGALPSAGQQVAPLPALPVPVATTVANRKLADEADALSRHLVHLKSEVKLWEAKKKNSVVLPPNPPPPLTNVSLPGPFFPANTSTHNTSSSATTKPATKPTTTTPNHPTTNTPNYTPAPTFPIHPQVYSMPYVDPASTIQARTFAFQHLQACRPAKKFSGNDKTDYEFFKRQFLCSLDVPGITDRQKVMELQYYFADSAFQLIEHCVMNADPAMGFEEALLTLDQQFIQRRETALERIDDAISGNKVGANDTQGLLSVYSKLRSRYQMAATTGRAADFDHEIVIQTVLSRKFDQGIVDRWIDKCVHAAERGDEDPSFLQFLGFLNNLHSAAKRRQLVASRVSPASGPKPKGKTSSVAAGSTGKPPETKPEADVKPKGTPAAAPASAPSRPPFKARCPICSSDHKADVCPQLSTMDPDMIRGRLSRFGACFRCGSTSHLAKRCDAGVTCSTCQRPHATSLCRIQNPARPPPAADEPAPSGVPMGYLGSSPAS